MQLRFKRRIMYIKNNPWEIYFYITFLGFLGLLGFYFFNYFMINKYKGDIENYDNKIAEKSSTLNQQLNDISIKKYELAEYVYKEENNISWSKTISSLIGIYEDLKDIQNKQIGLELKDFKVNQESVQLVGEVTDMKNVYVSGGIIDKFTMPEFVDMIVIPSYNKINNNYEFNLDAKIKLNNDNR